ncbi:MAG TPA: hypothetical protein VI197_14400 [Polyangiaceae bacterium]
MQRSNWRTLSAGLFVVLAGALGCTEPQPGAPPAVSVTVTPPCDTPAAEFAKARRLLAEGRLHRTLRLLEGAIQSCPSSRHRGWGIEVEALAELGRHEDASALAWQILSSDDDPAVRKAARAALDLVKARTPPSTTPEQAQVASRGRLAAAHRLLVEAENLAHQGNGAAAAARYGEARAAYEAAWLARPPNGQALFMAGHCALEQGRSAEAQRLFDRALLELEADEPIEVVKRSSPIEKQVSSSKLLAWSSRDQLAAAEKNRVGLASAGKLGSVDLLLAAPVRALRFTPDGAFIVTGSEEGQLELWSALDGTLLWSVPTGHSPIMGLAATPDGAAVLTASAEGRVQIRSTLDGQQLPGLGAAAPDRWGSGGGLSDIAVSAHDRLLALAGTDRVYLWDRMAERQVASLGPHARAPRRVALSEDGALVASTARDGKTRIWHWKTGTLLGVLPGSALFDVSVAFLPGGKPTVVTSSTKIRLWEPKGRLLKVFGKAHSGELALSPDGSAVAVMPGATALSIWNVESGKPTGRIEVLRRDAPSETRVCRVGTRFFAFELCAERALPSD